MLQFGRGDDAAEHASGATRRAGRCGSFNSAAATLRFDYGYTNRDELSGITRYSDLAGLSKVGATSLTYDAKGRLTNLKHQNAAGSWFFNSTFTYDNADRLTGDQLNGTTKTYGYDAADQLTSDNGTAYTYDATGNRTNAGYTTGTGNQLTNDGTWTYTYDNEGNRTKKSKGAAQETWTYGYDQANHLIWVEKRASDGGTLQARIDYKYDALGRRAERGLDSDGNGTTDSIERYSYDGGDVVADLDSFNNLRTRRVYGDVELGGPAARISSAGAVAWYMADRQGSIVALSDASGVVQDQITYDGFGKVLTESGYAFGDRFKYTGQERDDVTGDQYHSARFYDPGVGRWLSRDPIGFAAGDANLYRYVGNDTMNAVDPSGTESWIDIHSPGYQSLFGSKRKPKPSGNPNYPNSFRPGRPADTSMWSLMYIPGPYRPGVHTQKPEGADPLCSPGLIIIPVGSAVMVTTNKPVQEPGEYQTTSSPVGTAIYSGVAGWNDVQQHLSNHKPNSLNALILSGHGGAAGGGVSVNTSDHTIAHPGHLNGPNLAKPVNRPVIAAIQNTLKPGAPIIIAACDQAHNTASLQQIANLTGRPVIATNGDAQSTASTDDWYVFKPKPNLPK